MRKTIKRKFALGTSNLNNVSKVPVEVEGGEVAQTPSGQVKNYQGPSHEQGGIDDTLPEGTTIFSDRISVDGKTMADRKKERDSRLDKFKKQLQRRPTDFITMNAVKRISQTNAMQDYTDLHVQNVIGATADDDMLQNAQQFAKGTGVKGVKAKRKNYALGTDNLGMAGPRTIPQINTTVNTNSFTAGDITGGVGSIISTVAPMINARNYWKNRIKITNPYKTYGDKTINTLQKNEDLIDQNKNIQLSKLATKKNATLLGNQQRASSVNTSNAMNLLTELGYSDEMVDVMSKANDLQINNNNLKAQTQLNIDATRMGGEANVQQNEKADVENYYSNMGKLASGFGTNVQQQAKLMNDRQTENEVVNMLPYMNSNGIGMKKTNRGYSPFVKQN